MGLENNNLFSRWNHGFDDSREFFNVISCFSRNPIGPNLRESIYMIHWLRGTLGWFSLDGLSGACLVGRLGVTSDQWAWSSADSGWLGVGGLFGRAGGRFTVVSAGTGAISGKGMRDTIGLGKWVVVLAVIMSAGTGAMSGKGMRDTIGLGKGVVVLVVIVGLQGSFGLGCGEFVGLTTSRLFLVFLWRRVVLG